MSTFETRKIALTLAVETGRGEGVSKEFVLDLADAYYNYLVNGPKPQKSGPEAAAK